MPIKLPATDESALNMTPMIDIVFNLVIFFMLSVDLSKKEYAALTLPRANHGVEDRPVQNPKAEDTRFIVNLTPDNSIFFKGQTWALNSDNKEEQNASLKSLRDALLDLVNKPNLREPDGASKVSILVRGDRTSKWKYVQWIMQICADPQIKIYKMQFAIDGPKVQ